MSKYIKEWLFCESGNAYKLPNICSIEVTGHSDYYKYWIILESDSKANEKEISKADYIEIINALKQRELDIAELLDTEDKTNPYWNFRQHLVEFAKCLEGWTDIEFTQGNNVESFDKVVDEFIRGMK